MKLRAFVGGLVLAAGTVACACSVQAADLPMRPAPAPVAPVAYAPPVYNWSGFYIGGHIGGGFENSNWTNPVTGANASFSDSGFLGGAQVGVNTQFNWFVLGLEGDFSWTSLIKGTSTDTLGNIMTTSPQWTSTVTGRAGVAFDRLLVYGKGGLALAEDESTFTPVGGATITDDFDAGRLDRRRRPRICAHRQLGFARRIRLSRLRHQAAQFRRSWLDQRRSQRPGSQSRVRL